MCVFIRSKIIICLLSGATRSIQSLKPSNSQKHQEEGFQATQKRKEKKKKGDLNRAGPIRKSTSQMLNYTICWLFTFRSLWYTPFRWQWATASISCWKYRLDSFSESLPWWTCTSVHPHQEATQKSFTSIFAKLTTSINNSFT